MQGCKILASIFTYILSLIILDAGLQYFSQYLSRNLFPYNPRCKVANFSKYLSRYLIPYNPRCKVLKFLLSFTRSAIPYNPECKVAKFLQISAQILKTLWFLDTITSLWIHAKIFRIHIFYTKGRCFFLLNLY